MAGAKIECVIGVDTVGDGGETTRVRQFIQRGKEFVFAEIATVDRIRAIGGIIHFVRFDELMVQARLADKILDYGSIMSGVTRGQRCNRERTGSQRFVGGPGQVGGVGSARESDDKGRKFGKASEQKSFFLFGRQRVALRSMNLN